ncbi:MAG TPA: hypothetical protein VGO64_08460, partial [Candidatus Limnocylindrales bacterium]|nr:hypothetical protein [Candidatus Limnocylindrales bacterium]
MEAFSPRPLETAPAIVPAISPAALAGFTSSITGSVILPGDSAFDAARGVHNTRFNRTPAVVVRAADAEDVART